MTEQTFNDLAATTVDGVKFVKVDDLRTLLMEAQGTFALLGLSGDLDAAKAVGMCTVTDALDSLLARL